MDLLALMLATAFGESASVDKISRSGRSAAPTELRVRLKNVDESLAVRDSDIQFFWTGEPHQVLTDLDNVNRPLLKCRHDSGKFK